MDDMTLSLVIAISVCVIILVMALHGYLRSLKIDSYKDKYVLITGCDTGIGNIAARRLDEMGFHVFAACLRPDKAKELASVSSDRLVPLTMDVTKEESVQSALGIVKEVLPKDTGLWALINNAGIVGPVGLCGWLSKEKFEEPMNVNLLGTVCVTTAFLPLVRREKGRILITSSVVGRVAIFPGPYTVSKYCLEGYSDWLRLQLLRHNVSVHTLEPGGHNSNITNADLHIASMEKEFSQLSSEMKEFYGESVKHNIAQKLSLAAKIYRFFKADAVSDRYIHAVSARYPKQRYIFGWDAQFFFRPLWLLPTCISDFLISSFLPVPEKC